NEPVVWLFTDELDHHGVGHIWFGLVGRMDKCYVGAEHVHGTVEHPVASNPSISRLPLMGIVSYCDVGVELHEVQRSLDTKLDRRVPRSTPGGDVQIDRTVPWWQALAQRAAHHADNCVYRVALPGFSNLQEFDDTVRREGKRVVSVSPSAFDSVQLNKMQAMYWVTRPYNPEKGQDTNIESYEREVIGAYSKHLATDRNAADWLI
ncbi:MAG: hypothetical protein KDI64_18950, partial [Candidatus Accumulibacter sp.]|nr:hypothetical protein [Accumulibacter sp.]